MRGGVPHRLIPIKITGGINQALANFTLLDDWSYNTGYCGRPEPIHLPHPNGTERVPVSQAARSQLWRAQQVYPRPISEAHLRVLCT